MYDIIGDVHGNLYLLKKLLKELSYEEVNGIWQHSTRKAIFCGDFVNRGCDVRKTLRLIQNMCIAQKAYAILGNHELGAVISYSFFTANEKIPSRIKKDYPSYERTKAAYLGKEKELKETMHWLRTLPFFLEFDNLRIVHACWDDRAIEIIKHTRPKGILRKSYLRNLSATPNSLLSSINLVTRGNIFTCPKDLILKCNKNISRRSFRMNWWNITNNETFHSLAFGNKFILPNYTVPKELMPQERNYDNQKLPVIFGHYCLGKGAYIIQNNLCCVDSCVTSTGILSAYRWNGESKLTKQHLISVSE